MRGTEEIREVWNQHFETINDSVGGQAEVTSVGIVQCRARLTGEGGRR